MDYWHKRYTCPYFTSSEKRRVCCEGGSRVSFETGGAAWAAPRGRSGCFYSGGRENGCQCRASGGRLVEDGSLRRDDHALQLLSADGLHA